MASVDITDRFLAVEEEQLTPLLASALLKFSVTEDVKRRAEELAEKTNFGTITEEEHAEYLQSIEMSELMSLFQAKARQVLATKS